jgi:hypothetical protein
VLEEALELGILAGEPAPGVVGGFAGISSNDDRGHGVSESSTTQATKKKTKTRQLNFGIPAISILSQKSTKHLRRIAVHDMSRGNVLA